MSITRQTCAVSRTGREALGPQHEILMPPNIKPLFVEYVLRNYIASLHLLITTTGVCVWCWLTVALPNNLWVPR